MVNLFLPWFNQVTSVTCTPRSLMVGMEMVKCTTLGVALGSPNTSDIEKANEIGCRICIAGYAPDMRV